MKLRTACAALIAAIAVPVLAQTGAPVKDPLATPAIDKREARQQQRIDQGVASGQLTAREAGRLEKGQARIENMEAKAKADGTVTAKERAHIQHAQNVQSRKIYREKHDQQHN